MCEKQHTAQLNKVIVSISHLQKKLFSFFNTTYTNENILRLLHDNTHTKIEDHP